MSFRLTTRKAAAPRRKSASNTTSTPLEIGFNAKYLLDIASQLESETAHFQLADPGSPTMVKDASDEGALFVLMPMRV